MFGRSAASRHHLPFQALTPSSRSSKLTSIAMGKSRRNRARGPQRSDPIQKPVKPPTDPELAALREKSILPVVRDLQSPEPGKRSAAAAAVANIIQDAKCRKLLLREQIVPIILTETLTDTSLEGRAAGWEILKLLAQEEEADFCVHLYRIDVLTAIEHAAKKVRCAATRPALGYRLPCTLTYMPSDYRFSQRARPGVFRQVI